MNIFLLSLYLCIIRMMAGEVKNSFEKFFEVSHDKNFHVDSFFDIFTELSNMNKEQKFKDGSFNIDSFFDVFIELKKGYDNAVDNDCDDRNDPDETKIGICCSSRFRIDSFFDVWTELSIEKGDQVDWDSFFDVFILLNKEFRRRRGRNPQTGKEIKIASADSTTTTSADDYYCCIDSFFDIFTELSVSGDSFFNMFTFSKKLEYGGDFNVDSFFDIFTELYITRKGNRLNSGDFQVDSFFDVFTELSSNTGDFPVDSFFDIWVKLNPDNGHFTIDSFFDVFTELDYKRRVNHIGDGNFRVDSFFDIFTELSTDGVDFQKEIFLDKFLALIHERRILDPDSDDDGLDDIDSFFDIFVEIDERRRKGRLQSIKSMELDIGNDIMIELGKKYAGENFDFKKFAKEFIKLFRKSSSTINVDSFFDVFFDIEYKRRGKRVAKFKAGAALSGKVNRNVMEEDPDPQKTNTCAMDVTYATNFFKLYDKGNQRRKELKLVGKDFNVDSFFDVFFDISGPGYFMVDSFFDISYRERCDGKDNDCDGISDGIDNDCDGIDNDCDGIDNDCNGSTQQTETNTGEYNLLGNNPQLFTSSDFSILLIVSLLGIGILFVIVCAIFAFVICSIVGKLISKIDGIKMNDDSK